MKAGDEVCQSWHLPWSQTKWNWDFVFLWQTNSLLACNKQGCSRLSLPKWPSCCTFTVLEYKAESQILALHVLSSEMEITEWERGLILGLGFFTQTCRAVSFPQYIQHPQALCVFPKWKAPCSTVLTPRLRSRASTEEVSREFLLLWSHPRREGDYSTCGFLSCHSLADSSPAHQWATLAVWSGLLGSGWPQTGSAGPRLFLPSPGLVWPSWAHRRWPCGSPGSQGLSPLGISVLRSQEKALAASKTYLDGEPWLMELQLNTLSRTRALLPTTNLWGSLKWWPFRKLHPFLVIPDNLFLRGFLHALIHYITPIPFIQ